LEQKNNFGNSYHLLIVLCGYVTKFYIVSIVHFKQNSKTLSSTEQSMLAVGIDVSSEKVEKAP
jgi:hypothetical protein